MSTLAQLSDATVGPVLLLFVGAAIVITIIFLAAQREVAKEREIRRVLESRLQQAAQPLETLSRERDNVLFEQHQRMNDLQIAKLTAEVEILQRQLQSRSLDEDRIEAGREYHELMVEKTKLEMDSLRLHIAELRKRMEDWRFGND